MDTGPSPLSAEFSGQIPFWFDLGHRFAERFFVALAIGRYNNVDLSSGNRNIANVTIASQQTHEWLQFGVRFTVDYQ